MTTDQWIFLAVNGVIALLNFQTARINNRTAKEKSPRGGIRKGSGKKKRR